MIKKLSVIMLFCLIGTQVIAMKRAREGSEEERLAKQQKVVDLSFLRSELLSFIEEGDFDDTINLLKRLNQYKNFDGRDSMFSISKSDKFNQYQKIALFNRLPKADFTDIEPESGTTPLHIAVEMNEPRLVQYLLYEKHVNPNVRDLNKCTPWLFVSNVKMADILWRAGANINVKDTFGRSILHLQPENRELIRHVLALGTTFGRDYEGQTPYQLQQSEGEQPNPDLQDEESARNATVAELSAEVKKPITHYIFGRSAGQEKKVVFPKFPTGYEESESETSSSESSDSDSEED